MAHGDFAVLAADEEPVHRSTPAGASKGGVADAARRLEVLQAAFQEAHAKVDVTARTWRVQGALATGFLLLLLVMRVVAWAQGITPGQTVVGMHFLTTGADIWCICCAVPLFVGGSRGCCVSSGCAGPAVTIICSMCVIDIAAFASFCLMDAPRPLAPETPKSPLTILEAVLGVWDLALLASVALELALCASTWRLYKELRVVGLYPPGSNPARGMKGDEVSLMELVCEVEDAKYLQQKCSCMGDLPKQDGPQRDAPKQDGSQRHAPKQDGSQRDVPKQDGSHRSAVIDGLP
mmetsp:Transcript_22406/g.64417  ORF Transcript_22406/g.64417 Transcript_22406/m.64417 type:complete len:292 (-) Transcript_22406:54-929(-)